MLLANHAHVSEAIVHGKRRYITHRLIKKNVSGVFGVVVF